MCSRHGGMDYLYNGKGQAGAGRLLEALQADKLGFLVKFQAMGRPSQTKCKAPED